jgi:hypothetical protein
MGHLIRHTSHNLRIRCPRLEHDAKSSVYKLFDAPRQIRALDVSLAATKPVFDRGRSAAAVVAAGHQCRRCVETRP